MTRAYDFHKSLNANSPEKWDDFFCIGRRTVHSTEAAVRKGRISVNLSTNLGSRDEGGEKGVQEKVLLGQSSWSSYDVDRIPYDRRFVLDSGASFHLISRNSLSPLEEARVYKADRPIELFLLFCC